MGSALDICLARCRCRNAYFMAALASNEAPRLPTLPCRHHFTITASRRAVLPQIAMVSIGRIAPLQRPPRGGPESGRKPSFHWGSEIALRRPSDTFAGRVHPRLRQVGYDGVLCPDHVPFEIDPECDHPARGAAADRRSGIPSQLGDVDRTTRRTAAFRSHPIFRRLPHHPCSDPAPVRTLAPRFGHRVRSRVQFHLNGFRPGDPQIGDARAKEVRLSRPS